MLEEQVRYLVLKFLAQVYPSDLSLQMIEALLYDWRIFITQDKLKKKIIKPLVEKGYAEIVEIELPAHTGSIKKLKLTAKGRALLDGEYIDELIKEV
jgi:hypothetical protein